MYILNRGILIVVKWQYIICVPVSHPTSRSIILCDCIYFIRDIKVVHRVVPIRFFSNDIRIVSILLNILRAL